MSELSEKQRDDLDEDRFAFPKERKEPLNNASHVRNAIALQPGRRRVRTTSATRRGGGSKSRRQAWRRGQREELARIGKK